jgi:hypothetical protein
MRSFKIFIAGTMLAATASLGVITPEAKATPSRGEDGGYLPTTEACVPPGVSVSDNVVDNTIRIRVNVPSSDNTCQISREIYLYIQDDRPQPLRLRAIYSQDSTWIGNYDGVKPGRYRVMGLSPTPSGIGDYTYVTSRDLGIDQVITVGRIEKSSQHPHPVAPPPPVEAAPPRQVVTTLDSDSKQLLRNFDQWMRWFQVNIWPQLQPLIRAIEGIKTS